MSNVADSQKRESHLKLKTDSGGEIMDCDHEVINSKYEAINSNLERILGIIYQSGHVEEYDYLIANPDLTRDPEYQRRYKCFWQMNRIGLSPEWLDLYFEMLQSNLKSPIGLGQVVDMLWQRPATVNGRYRLDFSFATKLVHMADPHSPIYDKKVAGFYDFRPPDPNGIFSSRKEKLMGFYNCLKIEYKRVLEYGLLSPSIGQFRIRFSRKPTDEKVVDYLIWACM